MIANYRVQAELSAVESTPDGKALVLGTVDGCVSVLAIVDTQKTDMGQYLAQMPSRDEEVSSSKWNRTPLHLVKTVLCKEIGDKLNLLKNYLKYNLVAQKKATIQATSLKSLTKSRWKSVITCYSPTSFIHSFTFSNTKFGDFLLKYNVSTPICSIFAWIEAF